MKKTILMMAMTLMVSAVVSNNVWADGDDPISFHPAVTVVAMLPFPEVLVMMEVVNQVEK